MGTERSSRFASVGFSLLAGILTVIHGCGKSPTAPDPPDPPAKMVRILITVSANYVLSGLPATGKVTYQPAGEGATIKNLGEQADLFEIEEGKTKKVTITIEGDGALKRVFKDVPLSGTKRFTTTVLELQDFHWEYFVLTPENSGMSSSWTGDGGCNPRWIPDTITVYINQPQNPTWPYPITEHGKERIRTTINGMQTASRGKIKSVTYVDGDKTDGRAEGHPNYPAIGEIWIFPSPPSDMGCCPNLNISWPTNGGVERSMTWLAIINTEVDYPDHELCDAMISGNQNGHPGWEIDYFEKWWPYVFSRPAYESGNDSMRFRIYRDHEEEIGFTDGVSGTIETGASVYSRSESANSILIDKAGAKDGAQLNESASKKPWKRVDKQPIRD